jgi:sulfonate transport system substrate-binding protein
MSKWFAIARRRLLLFFISGVFLAVLVNACTNSASPGTGTTAASPGSSPTAVPTVVRLDYAYYNPVSLVLKEKGWQRTTNCPLPPAFF